MKRYIPSKIEAKWQEEWELSGTYNFEFDQSREKFYNLVEFPYPSGDLHIGHWFAFTQPDAYARFKRMKGYSVFFPLGFDAFGLPAENAGIKRGIHPRDWTIANIASMRRQFTSLGTMIDWRYTLATCEPNYYKWNQWIFLKFLEQGLAYEGEILSNWCPSCKTVLANENVEGGKCWRCGSSVEQRMVNQWFFRITAYADRLMWPENPTLRWPISARTAQNNWIGRSEGLVIDFEGLKVFTTRPETIDGATFLVIAPEHPKLTELTTPEYLTEVKNYLEQVKSKSEVERKENKQKTGVFTGTLLNNPAIGEEIPVWVADYVLPGYGTGAIMGVPWADERDKEFATQFNLKVVETKFNASPDGESKVYYHLHDWSISRQRYWGTPVPIIRCPECGAVPVPYEDLPVELPYNVDFAPTGKPPLATDKDWMRVKCPKCGGGAQRDPQTLDTFVDSAWYYYRYTDPEFTGGPFDPERVKQVLPLDIYFGGGEHTVGHTLYARFVTKALHDLGMVEFDEFAERRVQHGIVLGPDGNKMSKSKGNVINPDEVVKEYGADTVRVYLCFMMPYDATAAWSTEAIAGVHRFLIRVWELFDRVDMEAKPTREGLVKLNRTIKKVEEDLEEIKSNTAVAALMEWLNYLSKKPSVSKQEYKTFLLLLSPFAPHLTEELWTVYLNNSYSIHQQTWPRFDDNCLEESQLSIAVQVNGKLRDVILIPSDIQNNREDIEKRALSSSKIEKHLSGKLPVKTIYVKGKILNLVV